MAAEHLSEYSTCGRHVVDHPSGTKVVTAHPAALKAVKGIRRVTEATPTVAGTQAGSSLQFRITKNLVEGLIRSTYLEFTLSETGGVNPVTFAQAVPFFIDKMEIALNGSSHAHTTVYGREIFEQLAFIPRYGGLDHLQGSLNLDPDTFQPAATLAAGTTQLYRLPLYFSLINGLSPETLNDNDVVIRIDLSDIVSAGNLGTLRIDDIRMKFESFWHPIANEKLVDLSRRYPTVHPYLDLLNTSESRYIGAGQTIEVLLGGIQTNNDVFMLTVGIRASTSLDNAIVYEDCTAVEFDFQKNNKNTLIGSERTGEALYYELSETLPKNNLMWSTLGVIPIILTPNVADSILHRVSSGGVPMDGNQYLTLKTPGTWTAGNYFIDVTAWSIAAMNMDQKGKFRQLF